MPSSSTAPSVGWYRPSISRWMRDLARADAADQRDALAGRDLEAHAVERRVLAARVGEVDVAELDLAAQLRPVDEVVARPGARPAAPSSARATRIAVRAPWYCISRPTICPAGASARPASMRGGDQRAHRQLALADQVDADHDRSPPSPACVSEAGAVHRATTTARACCTLVRARKALARSQRACITPSAPCDLMVSMPVRLSISVALRCAPAR